MTHCSPANSKAFGQFAVLLLALATISALTAAGAAAQADTPGWQLDSSNWWRAIDLLPEPILRRVQLGEYQFTVEEVASDRLKDNYSRSFWEASRANAGKYEIDAATCGLKDPVTGKMPVFYFGFPFPSIDAPHDPDAACRIAWNVESASSIGGGGGATMLLWSFYAQQEWEHLEVSLTTKNFLGRQSGPIDNPEKLRLVAAGKSVGNNAFEAVGVLTKRFNDWDTADEQWSYLPTLRRVRRLTATTLSEPVAGLSIYADDYNCYGSKLEASRWKLVGEGQVLAPLLSVTPLPQVPVSATHSEVRVPESLPEVGRARVHNAPWLTSSPLVMVPRPVWIVEVQPRDHASRFGKAVLYIDRELYRIWWRFVYDQTGQYFYNAMCVTYWSSSTDGAFKVVHPSNVVGFNEQTSMATVAGKPSKVFLEQHFASDEPRVLPRPHSDPF